MIPRSAHPPRSWTTAAGPSGEGGVRLDPVRQQLVDEAPVVVEPALVDRPPASGNTRGHEMLNR